MYKCHNKKKPTIQEQCNYAVKTKDGSINQTDSVTTIHITVLTVHRELKTHPNKFPIRIQWKF